MGTHHELPGGNSVEVRDPATVTYRARKPLIMPHERLQKAYRDALTPKEMPASPRPLAEGEEAAPIEIEVTEGLLDDSDSLTVNLAIALVESWTFGDAPTTADDVLDIPALCLDALDAILMDYFPKLFMLPKPDGEEHPTTP